ncbi:MAG: sugar-binding domain-containing protein [Bacteroidota bacterium]
MPKKFLCTLLFLGTFLAFKAQPGTISSHLDNSQLVRDLSGAKWKMKFMLPGEGEKAGLHKLPPEDIETLVWNAAEVPGDVYTDSWKVGLIDDPYFGRNSVKAQWIQHYEWWYAYQFNVTQDLSDQVVRLDFEGVDYACEVWLNGHYLGKHEGAFSPFSFDITEQIRSSKHWLKSANLLMVKLDPPPKVNAMVAGRKTPWFGDYWRDLIPFGIWRPIKIVSTGKSRILDLYAHSQLAEDGSAKVKLEVEIENTTNQQKEIQVISSIEGKNFTSEPLILDLKHHAPPGRSKVVQTFTLHDPQLWWPWDLGKPNIYQAKVSLKEDDINQDFQESSFGIREVSMAWNPGFTRDEVSFPRTTLINGKVHFIRSACWGGPPDIFVGRTSIEEYKELIRLAKAANLNNIRIFGWHPPEIPEFYDLCDEAGLTVWQDVIPLGTGNIPQDEAFKQTVIAEAIAVLKVRRNHPSLIMIEGGEEMFLRSGDPHFTRRFLEELGDSLQSHCKLPYVPDSPMTDEAAREAGFKSKEAVHALRYFYGMGFTGLMEDWIGTLNYPIVPELAITSVPSVESLRKFIPEDELWPPGLSWGHHWADFGRLKAQNFDAFGEEKNTSLEEFVEATQHAQGIIFQLAVEKLRRDKPQLSGIALCHFITYWPDMKWGIVDNYQQPKISYEYVKKSYQPLLISMQVDRRRWKPGENFSGELWVINDFDESYQDLRIDMQIKDEAEKEVFAQTFAVEKVDPLSARSILPFQFTLSDDIKSQFTVKIQLTSQEGSVLSANDYMLLIGDQDAARKKLLEMGKAIRELNDQYTYGNYFRFYEMMGEGQTKYDSQQLKPKAKGFRKE